uniref:Uncharacterized protein n=1 Tax=Leersia perrieri TaxID=77586 RepID=A0A0D9W2V6_9ORYZ
METPSVLGESRWTKMGSKIAVRNVQALAASADQQTAETLERYIRPDIDRDAVLVEHSGEVPVIDLGKLLDGVTGEAEAAVLKFACEEWGFFQLANHGIPEEVIVNIKRDLHKFFELPLHVKNAYAQSPGDVQGYGQAFVMSDDQKLDWADLLGIFSQPPQGRDMRYWPTEPETFRSSIEDYSSELMKVAHQVVASIAATLDVDTEIMGDKYSVQFLRMNYYPPCMPMPEKIMTNGKYKSIEHRVTINAHKERLSISAFHIPKYDGIISPMKAAIDEKLLYKTTRVGEYARLYMSNKLEAKRALDHAKI